MKTERKRRPRKEAKRARKTSKGPSKKSLEHWAKHQARKTPRQIKIQETIEIITTHTWIEATIEKAQKEAITLILGEEIIEMYEIPEEGGKFNIGGYGIEILPPPKEDLPSRREMENASIIMKTDVWMMKDVAAAIMEELV